MWVAFAFGSAIFAGMTSVLAKLGMKKIDSNLATALRTIVVAVFAWLMVFIVGSQSTISSIETKTFVFLILSGLATGASWLCYFKALQLGDVNKVVPIDKSSTVLTMVLAIVFLGESITVFKFVCMIMILTGTMMMLERKDLSSQLKTGTNAEAQGEANKKSLSWIVYAVLSAVFASLTAILGKVGIENIESSLGTAIRTIVVLLMAWLIVIMQGKQGEIKKIDKKGWLFVMLSGIATGASWLCYYRALQTGPASVVVPIDKLSLLITVAFGYVAFKEKLKPKAIVGLALITAGTLMLIYT